MTPTQKARAEKIARARELRAQGLMLKDVQRIMQDEGYKIAIPTICQYTSDLDTPEHRGRRPTYTTSEARAEARKRYKREYWHKHKTRLTQERLEALANETEAERADRLEYQRIKAQARKERRAQESN